MVLDPKPALKRRVERRKPRFGQFLPMGQGWAKPPRLMQINLGRRLWVQVVVATLGLGAVLHSL